MSFFVPTRFVWRFGGRQVHLCGSFTRWVETIPMASVDGTPGVFAVVVHLPPGYHQYKFIVDGKWMHDETAPYMPDPLGNVNNWLFVRKIDPPAAVPGLGFDQHAAIMQQLQEQQQQAAAAAALSQQQQQQQQAAQAAAAQVVAQQQQAAAVAQQQLQAQLQQQQQQQQPQQQQQQALQAQQAAFNQQQRAAASQVQPLPGNPAAAAAAGSGGLSHPGMLQPGTAAGPAATAAAGGGVSSRVPPAQALQAPPQQRMQQLLPGRSPPASGSPPGDGDVDMAAADSVVAPIILHNEREPDLTKKKVSDFLHAHSAYELIPESGKVVLLDLDLPIRQAFHALHEQGIASAPLYDSQCGAVVGVISASDFIHTLRRLRNAVSSGSNPLSEAEMDAHTIRAMREECLLEGRPPKPLVFVRPSDSLARVVRTLFQHKCSMAPILSGEPGQPSASVLHIATLSGVLTCLMRHFRASLASLPLLAQPLGALPLGTWAPDTQFLPAGGGTAAAADASGLANGAPVAKDRAAAAAAGKGAGYGAVAGRTVAPLHAVTPGMALTSALGMLLDAGVSALPVVNEGGVLQDIYARADITKLCKGNAYNRLQWEDVTVGQALSLSNPNPAAWSQASAGSGGHLLVPDYAVQANPHLIDSQLRGGAPGAAQGASYSAQQTLAGGRVAVAFQDDPLRAVVERLAAPGVRRLVVVDRSSRRVQGLVSLSDVAAYIFL